MPDEQVIDTRPWERLHELAQAGDAQALGAFIESLPVAETVRAVSRLDADERTRIMGMLPAGISQAEVEEAGEGLVAD